MNRNTLAQCPVADPGGVCSATYTGTGSVVLPTGTFPLSDVCISGTLTLDEDFYIAPATVVRMEPDAKIIVQNGVLLVIDNNVQIFGKTQMWDYIQVDGGGQVQCTGASIRDAEIGIKALNGTEESIIKINSTTFCNNEMGIYFGPIIADLSSSVIGCSFSAPGMKAPLTGQQGDYGIFVDKVEKFSSGGCTIGDYVPYSSSTTFNTFQNVSIGIRTYRSDVVINDCFFDNIFEVPASYMPDVFPIDENFIAMAICATSELNYPVKVVVGTTLSPGTINNLITNTTTGIYCDTYITSEISFNNIDGSVASGDYNLSNGIQLANTNSNHTVLNNTITDFRNIGIFVTNLTGFSTASIRNNIINTTILYPDLVPEYGIRVHMGTITTSLTCDIRNNDIDRVKTGIWVRNTEDVLVSDNKVDFIFPAGSDPLIPAHGIFIEKCDDAHILYNKCIGTCTGGCSQRVRPLYVQNSLNFLADHNYLGGANRYGILLDQPCTDGNMTCNEIHNSNWGIGLRQLGVDGVGPVQGIGGLPSENSFFLNHTDDSRVHTFGPFPGTDGTSIPWIYQAFPSEFDLPDVTTTTTPPLSSEISPTLNEVSTTCYSGLRLTEEALYEMFANKYSDWVDDYIANGYGENVNNYYKAWNFYNTVREDTIVQKYLSGELADVFAMLSENNISKFYNVLHDSSTGYISAKEINNTITPENRIEEYWKLTNDIYFNSMNDDGNLVISDADFSTLKEIALLDGGENGFGVYNARGMTGTEIYNFEEEDIEGERTFDYNMQIHFYPNPANDILYFSNLITQETGRIIVSNIEGEHVLVKGYEGELYSLDISKLNNGFYILEILISEETALRKKFIIIK